MNSPVNRTGNADGICSRRRWMATGGLWACCGRWAMASTPHPAEVDAGATLPLSAITLHRADGEPGLATLADWSEHGMLFHPPSDDVPSPLRPIPAATVFSPERIVAWAYWPGLRRRGGVWLLDGSWLCGDVHVKPGGAVEVISDWWDAPTIAPQLVRAIVFAPPYSLSVWVERWKTMRQAEGTSDTVWLASGKTLGGVIRWSDEPGGGNTFEVEAQGTSTAVSLSSVEAIQYAPPLIGPLPRKTAGFSLALSDGSLLHCRDAEFVDEGNGVVVQLDSGIVLRSWETPSRVASAVRGVFGSWHHSRFLSDLPYADYRFYGTGTLAWPLGIDTDVRGWPLTIDDQGLALKGIGMHATSRVAYRHDGAPARLRAELRFARPESSEQRLGSVTAQVLVARQGRLNSAVSVDLRRTDSPAVRWIDVDLTGAQLFVLVVSESDYEQLGDSVVWLHARIDPVTVAEQQSVP